MITRKEHGGDVDARPCVRYHVTDADGQCIPDACVGRSGLCGYPRKYQARNAMLRYRSDLAAFASLEALS